MAIIVRYDEGARNHEVSAGSVVRPSQSSSHRANILAGKHREVGIGARGGKYRGYKATTYTVDFGLRFWMRGRKAAVEVRRRG